MSQAAASQQVKRLEEMLDCRLFERAGRRLVLAPAGERLLAQAQRLVAQSDELLSSMRHARRSRARCGSACPTTSSAASCRPSCAASPRPSPGCGSAWCARIRRWCASSCASGGVDLALTTETECGRHGETLRTDRLVWVGVPGGDAHLKDPLPVSLGAPTCVFRPVAIEALGKARRDWRAVCEVSRLEPVHAAIEAGLAVAPLLRSSVPERFEIFEGRPPRGAPAGAAGVPHQPLCAARAQPRRARSRRPCAGELCRARPAAPQQLIRSGAGLVGPCATIIGPQTGCRCVFCSDGLFRLGLPGMAYLAVTGNLQFKLPASMLGLRGAGGGQAVGRAQCADQRSRPARPRPGLKQISDRFE